MNRPIFHVCPRNQGQIVEVAYAACYGDVVRRITDRSNQGITFDVAKMLRNDEGDYWQTEPSNRRWRKISEKDAERYLRGDMM